MTEQPHILIVDDDKKIRYLLKKYLKENQMLVSYAEDAAGAKNIMQDFVFDIMILDVMMPGQNGFEFASEVRAKSQIPIIMLTAMGETQDKITGFENGVDDYLAKPFEPKELLLRIYSILRRIPKEKVEQESISLGRCQYNPKYEELVCGTDSVSLTSAEKLMLKVLYKNKGETMSREQLAEELSLMDNVRTVDVQVTRLRKKIEENTKNPRYIQTIRGKGYVLIPD